MEIGSGKEVYMRKNAIVILLRPLLLPLLSLETTAAKPGVSPSAGTNVTELSSHGVAIFTPPALYGKLWRLRLPSVSQQASSDLTFCLHCHRASQEAPDTPGFLPSAHLVLLVFPASYVSPAL